jgi:hypothetical protein
MRMNATPKCDIASYSTQTVPAQNEAKQIIPAIFFIVISLGFSF